MESDEERSRMSAARTLNLEFVVLIVIQNLCGGGGADDKFDILVVKVVYIKITASSQQVSQVPHLLDSRRHLAVHHFHN